MHTLIIGGSRGIGWELAKIYSANCDQVTVTGRKQPDLFNDQITFIGINLSGNN